MTGCKGFKGQGVRHRCDHLLVMCSFTRQVWSAILTYLQIQHIPVGHQTLPEWWTQLRQLLPAAKRHGFDRLFALVSWHIWKERNARVFRNEEEQLQQLLTTIKFEADLWITAGARHLGCLRDS